MALPFLAVSAPPVKFRFGSSGIAVYGDTTWQDNPDCQQHPNYFYVAGNKGTYKFQSDGRPSSEKFDSAYFSMSLVTSCTGDTIVRMVVEDYSWWSESGPDGSGVTVTANKQLTTGRVAKTGMAYVYTEICTLYIDPEYEDYYYYDCSYEGGEEKEVTVTAALVGTGPSYNSRHSGNNRFSFGRSQYRSNGMYRDATAVMTATIEGYGTVNIPTASIWDSYGSLGRDTSSSMDFYKL
jgi:hypothetical protein